MTSGLPKPPCLLLFVVAIVFAVACGQASAQLLSCKESIPLYEKGDYEARIKADPNDYFAYVMKGWALYEQKRWDDAVKELDRALELRPNDSIALEARGRIFFGMAQFDRSMDDLTNAITADQQNFFAFYYRAQIYSHLDNDVMAKDDLEQALRIKPNLIEAYNDLGKILGKLGDSESAKAMSANTLDSLTKELNDPKLSGCRYGLLLTRGTAYINDSEYRFAIDDLTAAINLQESEYTPYYRRGFAYLATGSTRNAIKDFTKSIELSPDWAGSYRLRAIAYRTLGETKLAEKDEVQYKLLSGGTIEEK